MAKAKEQDKQGRKLICENRKARFAYAIGERLEAGVVLTGSEVKSCREGRAQLADAYVQVVRGEAFLIGSHIAEYSHAGHFTHDPSRTRKLLLHKKQIDALEIEIRQRGKSLVPLSLYFKDGKVKLEVGIAKGKTFEDRRQTIKERDARRELERVHRRVR